MSTNTYLGKIVFNNVSLATNQVSVAIPILNTDNISIQFNWTGTPVGTFGASVCSDAVTSPTGVVTGGTWTPILLSSPQTPTVSGSAGNGVIELNQLGDGYLQVTYTSTSGTGNCTAYLTGKSL